MSVSFDKIYPEVTLSVKVTDQWIDSPYGVRGTAIKWISVASAYCLKEPMNLGRRRGMHYADPLCSPIRDDWGS
ncbi:hypothetical protein TNCV_2251791 [Trichonephila clavipes]|nr:hypothetical protein TNCV_2251791 [Trichonephila clavipes]